MGSCMIQGLRLRYVNKSDVVDFGIWLHTRPPQRLPSSTGRDSASGLVRRGQKNISLLPTEHLTCPVELDESFLFVHKV